MVIFGWKSSQILGGPGSTHRHLSVLADADAGGGGAEDEERAVLRPNPQPDTASKMQDSKVSHTKKTFK